MLAPAIVSSPSSANKELNVISDCVARLYAQAERERHQSEESGWRSVQQSMDLGDHLINAKALVGHGNWTDWIEANLPFGAAEARNYMNVARGRDSIVKAHGLDPQSITSLRSALAVIANPKPEPHGNTNALVFTIEPSGAAGAEADGKTLGRRSRPYGEWAAADRHRAFHEWPDQRVSTVLMLDAAGWTTDRIAEFTGQPPNHVTAILDPQPPTRFGHRDEGARQIWETSVSHDEAMVAYKAMVDHRMFGSLRAGYWSAAANCELEGFGSVRPILEAGERRYRLRQQAARERASALDEFEDEQYENVAHTRRFLLLLRYAATRDSRFALKTGAETEGRAEPPTLDDLFREAGPEFDRLEGSA